MQEDPWKHRTSGMVCATCMWWIAKTPAAGYEETSKEYEETRERSAKLGRCRKRAPLADKGFAPTFETDWCGDHRLDENKI